MSGAWRRRCCCGAEEPPPESCDCTECPTAYVATWSASLRYENTVTGVFWEWSYGGASATLTNGGFGSCSYWVDGAASGSMAYEVSDYDPTDPCFGGPLEGSCDISGWDQDTLPLVSPVCNLSVLFPTLVSTLGVLTPTFWMVGILPVTRNHPFDGSWSCACNPFDDALYPMTRRVYDMFLVYERVSPCLGSLGALRGIGVPSLDLSSIILMSSGTHTAGDWLITASGGVSFA